MDHERLAHMLRCPACGKEMRYKPRVKSYCCDGQVLHTYRVHEQIADLVHGEPAGRQKRINRIFSWMAGRRYEKSVTGATWFDRLVVKTMWGTTKFIPLLFEMLDSVASDCEPGFFLDLPVGTGVFTAGEYSLQPNLEFIGADYNRGMLEAAQEKVEAEDFGNVMLVRVDVAHLPFADECFTGIMTMNGIDAFPDKPRALDDLVRVLKPGGKIAGSTYVWGERWLTDVICGGIMAAFGGFTRPIYREQELVTALETRGITKMVTKKVGPILFFSGRKATATA